MPEKNNRKKEKFNRKPVTAFDFANSPGNFNETDKDGKSKKQNG